MSSMSVSTIDGGHYLQARKSVQIVLPQPSADTQDSSVDTNDWFAALRKGVKSAMACLLGWRRSSNKRGPASNMTIKEKIHPRYLEFEPLCCLSSCLVRGGCYSVVAFEVLYVVVTSFVIALKIHDGGRMDFWDDLDTLNYNAIVTHQVSLYLLALFDLVTLGMALSLTFGLVSFQRIFIKIHWRFDFFSLAFNIVEFILYIFALSSEGPETWSWKNVLLVISFACQIPLQIWAITVVKSCYDFYVLLYVFVTLTEK